MRRALWVGAAILAVAAGLRFHLLDGQSLWNDEALSVELAGEPLPVIAMKSAQDIHPPLYYALLKGWMAFVGDSELAVRSLSVLASLLLLGAVLRLAGDVAGRRGMAVAGLIVAASPLHLKYAQETRMYALLGLWVALAPLVAWRIGAGRRGGLSAWLAYTIRAWGR